MRVLNLIRAVSAVGLEAGWLFALEYKSKVDETCMIDEIIFLGVLLVLFDVVAGVIVEGVSHSVNLTCQPLV